MSKSIMPLAGEIVRYGKDKNTGEYIRGAKVAYAEYEGDVCTGIEAVKSTRDFAEFCDTHKGEMLSGSVGYDQRGRAALIYQGDNK